MFQFLTHVHVELSRSMAAFLEMPQYVAYQKNVAYGLFTVSTKSHTFNRYCTIIPVSCAYSCPTIYGGALNMLKGGLDPWSEA